MFVGLAVAGPEYGTGPGMFHLFTHAFFKALLFLGAGSVLYALHHAMHREVQDMRLMGGLATRMPITAITWLIATLAISGFPGFSGFFSKETIIGLAYDHQQWGLYALTLVTAGLTAFYMLRAFILAFGGKGGYLGGLWGGTYRGEGEVHRVSTDNDDPFDIARYPFHHRRLLGRVFHLPKSSCKTLKYCSAARSLPDTWIGVAISLAGFIVAYAIYARVELTKIEAFVQSRPVLRTVHRILYNRYYIDDLYDWITEYIVLKGICWLAQAFDTYVVDGLVNGVASLITDIGNGARRIETGKVQSYMIGFFGGVAVLAILAFVLINAMR